MRSGRRATPAAAALAVSALLVATSLGGCSTTQEKAAAQRAQSKRILKAREHKQRAKSHDHGSKER